MTRRSGVLGAMAALVAALALSAAPSTASAAFGVAKWEAGTCKASNCNYESSESVFFTQLAGRPPFGITDFTFNANGVGLPEGSVKDVRVDLPTGLSVNPQATSAQCAEAQVESSSCPAASKVGTVEATAFNLLGLVAVPVSTTVYDVVPKQGEPAEFGFRLNVPLLLDISIFLEGSVNWEGDYHEGFTIREVPNSVPLVRNRLIFEGQAGDGSFITVGSNCGGSTTTGLTVDSHENPGSFLHYDTTPIIPVGPRINPTGCDKVPFDPGIAVSPGTNQTDSPTGPAVTATVPFEASAAIGQSNVKRAEVSLPSGMGLNPAAADALEFCTDAQFGKGKAIGDLSRTTDPAGVHPPPIGCPAASKIGTVSIETPVLPAGSLPGTVYLGEQLSRNPSTGKEYRIFVNAESPRYGVYVRLLGEVLADPVTGQLTARFDDPAHGGLPQVPFSSFKLQLDGAKGTLTSPPTCGPNTTAARMTAWALDKVSTPSSSFTLTSAPGGGGCAKSLAERPFGPSFNAKATTETPLDYTSFVARIARTDGQQELKGVNLVLPEGATAKLAGVPYCTAKEIDAAAGRPGANEQRNPSCPDNSQIGVATVQAGSGSSPIEIPGKVYLAGPYRGAKISLVVITPAIAGPFDLGVVVVQVALNLNPETAQINPVAEIPHVFGGAKLDVRSVFVNVNRKNFALNGTNCRPGATAGTVQGGGADPTNPAAWSAVPVSSPFRLKGCGGLPFHPRLGLRLYGKTHRASNPKLRAVLLARPGDANIARASVALPHALFLDQSSLAKVCTRVKFAADECPKSSVYGFAKAETPLLGKPLEGPVFLRSSEHELPDLVAHLEGQVDIDLVGRIDSYKGGIRTTFDTVPDVPVSKFVMILPGGRHGLLEASTNLCAKPVRAIVQLKGQNGKTANRHQRLATPCRHKRHRRAHRRRPHRKAHQKGHRPGA
jgi:hypothetical protein